MPYKNPEDAKKRGRKYYLEHKEEILKKAKLYSLKPENKEKILKCNISRREEKMKYDKQYCIDNKEKRKKYWEKYNSIIENKNKIATYKKLYYIKSKEKRNNYENNRRKTDLKYNLNCRMRKAIRRSLNSIKNNRRWEDLVGYTCEDLIRRLKKTMPTGYTWQDLLQGKLHIDHIIPVSAHNYTKPEHLDFKRCWTLKNLRLLPAKENMAKNAKIIKPFQLAFRI